MKKLFLSTLFAVSAFFGNAQTNPDYYVSPGLENYVDTFLIWVNQDGWNLNTVIKHQPFYVVLSHDIERDLDDKAGMALGMNDDSRVMVVINTDAWILLTDYERQDLINHELMHDIFNVRHTDEDKEFKLMHPSSYPRDWHDTILRFANALKDLNDEYEASQGDNIVDGAYYNVDPLLEPYLESFIDLAALKGIDLSYIYQDNIVIKFIDHDIKTNVATSYKRNRDGIYIVVNRKRFNERTEEGRKYVMFHEFGHDILDFPHLEAPDRGMMEPTAYTGFFKNYVRFSKDRQVLYLYKSLNTMFDRYLGDGINDEYVEYNATIIIWGAGQKETLVRIYDNGDVAIKGYVNDKFSFFRAKTRHYNFATKSHLIKDPKYRQRWDIIKNGRYVGRIFLP